jgi:hypothetical protein
MITLRHLSFPALTFCILVIYGFVMIVRIKTKRLPEDALQFYYGLSHIQILFSFLATAMGFIKCFQFSSTSGLMKLELLNENLGEVLLGLSISVFAVFILVALVALFTGIRPIIRKTEPIQVITFLFDVCVLMSLVLLTVSHYTD